MKPHKHAEIIKAWADGAEIEFFDKIAEEWLETSAPYWSENNEYRVKPEPTTKKVKLLAYFNGVNLFWKVGCMPVSSDCKRVPSEDKEIEYKV